MQKIFVLAAWGLAAAGIVCAQPRCVRVTVTDPANLAVAGARVSSDGGSAVTDQRGRAELCSPGSEVRISAGGFTAVTETLAPDADVLDVELHTIAPTAATVVVTGDPEPRALSEVDRSLVVLNVAERDTVSWSFADLLKQDSSVHLRERGPDGTQADLSIRGSGFDQVLVLINGMRVSDAQTGHHALDLPLPLESVQQVEVLHGSGATLYGSDAIGGTINFVTRKPEGSELKLMGGIGDFGWNRTAGYGAIRRGIWTQTASLARDFSTGFAEGRDFRNVSGSTQTYLDTSVGTTSILFAANDRPFGAKDFYGPWNSWEKTGTKFLSASQTLGRGGNLQQRFQFAYRRHTDHFILYKYDPDVFQSQHMLDTWQGGYTATGDWTSKARWSAGAQYVAEDIESNRLGNHLRHRASIFGVLDLRPTERLTVSLGLREEAWRRWRIQTLPTMSAGYWLGRGVKVRGQIGAAFRMPTYTDLYYSDPGNVGNPNLKPEQALNFEGGLDWYAPEGTTVSMTVFRRLEDNTIDYVRDPGQTIFQALNFQKLAFTGGEIQVRKRFRPEAEVWGNYTRLTASRDLPTDAVSRYVFNFPTHQATMGYRGVWGPGLLVKTQLGVYERTWQSTKALWDVSIGWNRGKYHPFVQASNLLDTQHQAFQGLAQPGRWLRGGLEWNVF
ncbi:MAG: TonB-dependent receptor [Acidobacteria bacterium]|nr:TonB-dependent receptor [Acidobacteriota bacterium]